MEYKSQYNQDRFLNENLFKNKKNGVFVDIGAHDGVSCSNSYFYEKELGWNGLCIEPIPELFNQLDKVRDCHKIMGCAWNENTTKTFRYVKGIEMLSGILDTYDDAHIKRIDDECDAEQKQYEDIEMKCYDVNELLEKYNLYNIDMFSIDTEGSEYEILKNIDFKKFNIRVVLVENNYNNQNLVELMVKNGYVLAAKLNIDDVYLKI